MKTLYFEAAGLEDAKYNGVCCRIRTAFYNLDHKKIYIEFICGHQQNKKQKTEFHYLICDYCFYITEDPRHDDCNYSRLDCERNQRAGEIPYTAENILFFVNKHCNCDFDRMEVLPNLAGYRVFSGNHEINKGYNMMDDFEYNPELTARRIAKVAELKEKYTRLFNQRYDNTSYFVRDGKLTVCINVSEKARFAAGITEREFTVEV